MLLPASSSSLPATAKLITWLPGLPIALEVWTKTSGALPTWSLRTSSGSGSQHLYPVHLLGFLSPWGLENPQASAWLTPVSPPVHSFSCSFLLKSYFGGYSPLSHSCQVAPIRSPNLTLQHPGSPQSALYIVIVGFLVCPTPTLTLNLEVRAVVCRYPAWSGAQSDCSGDEASLIGRGCGGAFRRRGWGVGVGLDRS